MITLQESILKAGWNPSNSELIKDFLVAQDATWENYEVDLSESGTLAVRTEKGTATTARITKSEVLADFKVKEIRVQGAASLIINNPPDHLSITTDNEWNTLQLIGNGKNTRLTGLTIWAAGNIYLDKVGVLSMKNCQLSLNDDKDIELHISDLTGLGKFDGVYLDRIEEVNVYTSEKYIQPIIKALGVEPGKDEKFFTSAQLRKIFGFNGKQKYLDRVKLYLEDLDTDIWMRRERNGWLVY